MMSTYVIVHRHPNQYRGSAETAAAWTAWFQNLGASIVDLGNPVFERSSLGDCGADTRLGGYTLIEADDLEGAVALASGCPILADGGGVEVGKLAPVPGRQHPARTY